MSHVPGGLVYKRMLNTYRPVIRSICADGPVWSLVGTPINNTFPIHSVAAGAGFGVANFNKAGQPGVIYTLDNGTTWIEATIPGTFGLSGDQSISFGSSAFVSIVNAVQVIRSVDAVNWSVITLPAYGAFYRMSYLFGSIFAAPQSTAVVYSLDEGINWIQSAAIAGLGTMTSNAVSTATGAVIAGVDAPLTGGRVARSADGISWSSIAAPWSATLAPEALATDGSRIVAIGGGVTANDNAYYSDDDGLTWNLISLPGLGNTRWRDIQYSNGIWLAVGITSIPGNPNVAISTDGASWSVAIQQAPTSAGISSISPLAGTWFGQLEGLQNQIRVGVCF